MVRAARHYDSGDERRPGPSPTEGHGKQASRIERQDRRKKNLWSTTGRAPDAPSAFGLSHSKARCGCGIVLRAERHYKPWARKSCDEDVSSEASLFSELLQLPATGVKGPYERKALEHCLTALVFLLKLQLFLTGHASPAGEPVSGHLAFIHTPEVASSHRLDVGMFLLKYFGTAWTVVPVSC